MARFDLYSGVGSGTGYVIDVQADILESLATRVVIPLLQHEGAKVVRDLNPMVRIDDADYVLMTQELAAVPRSILRRKIGSLSDRRDDITRALDVLLIGF
jgi:toxin CcdB